MHSRTIVITVLAVIALFATSLLAQEVEPRTVKADITPDDLRSLLDPLTADDLKIEVDGWQALVSAKAWETAEAKVAGQPTEALVAERTALADRMKIVLEAWEAKGGEPEPFRTWLNIAADVALPKDAGALWSMGYDWVTSPTGGIALGINIVLFLVTIVAFKILASVLAGLTRKAVGAMRNTSELLRSFFVNVVKKVTMMLGLIIGLSVLGVNVGPFVAAIGAVGFVIAFALQGTLSNFASGIMILLYRPYDLGDVVGISGVTGTVDAMSLVSTTIRTGDNQVVIVPNGSIWGDVITNITGEKTRRVDLVMGIGYDDDMAKAEKVLREIVEGHPKVLKDPVPTIMVSELADSSVNFIVRPWALTSDYWTVQREITRQVKERFDAEGISIPYPHSEVYVHQVEASSD